MPKVLTPSNLRKRTLESPEWYIREVLGQTPWDKNIEIVRSVLQNRRTAVAGCVGSGKSFSGALAVFAFLHMFAPAEIYCTAPTFRQVKKIQFKEIRKIHKTARAPLDDRKLLDTEWKIDDDWFVLGFSPKNPDAIHGLHARNILIWIDEAQGVPQDVIEAAENAMAGGNARMLLTFNPNASQGEEAYEAAHSKRHLYNYIRIPADETPNVKAGRTIIPGMIEKYQRDEWVETYGWNSNFVRVKVRSLYPKQSADAVIPIEWIEKAMAREGSEGRKVLGIDVARSLEGDRTVIAPMNGRRMEELIVIRGKDNVEVALRAESEAKARGAVRIYVDVVGIGSGVVDTLKRTLKVKGVRGINSHVNARDPKKFADLNSEMWWGFRESLNPKDPDPVSLPHDMELLGELSAFRWGPNRQGRTEVESKDEVKKRIKNKSPDKADAANLARYASASSGAIPSGGSSAKPGGDKARRTKSSGERFRRLRDRFGA